MIIVQYWDYKAGYTIDGGPWLPFEWLIPRNEVNGSSFTHVTRQTCQSRPQAMGMSFWILTYTGDIFEQFVRNFNCFRIDKRNRQQNSSNKNVHTCIRKYINLSGKHCFIKHWCLLMLVDACCLIDKIDKIVLNRLLSASFATRLYFSTKVTLI